MTPRYEQCPDCSGVGLSTNVSGNIVMCSKCKGNTVIPLVVEQYGMIDPAMGHEPLHFGEVTDLADWGVSGERYVLLSDYKALETELEQLYEAFRLAVSMVFRHEPGDSRAVSDEAVALAAIQCGPSVANDACWKIVRAANARLGQPTKDDDE